MHSEQKLREEKAETAKYDNDCPLLDHNNGLSQSRQIDRYRKRRYGQFAYSLVQPLSHDSIVFLVVRILDLADRHRYPQQTQCSPSPDQNSKFTVISSPGRRTYLPQFFCSFIHAVIKHTLIDQHEQIGKNGNNRHRNTIQKHCSLYRILRFTPFAALRLNPVAQCSGVK